LLCRQLPKEQCLIFPLTCIIVLIETFEEYGPQAEKGMLLSPEGFLVSK
jgi:hypothetical protein